MPFASKAQQRWMYANKPEMAREWQSVTPSSKKLPLYAGKKPRKKSLREYVSKL
jgi:hypothetical protein